MYCPKCGAQNIPEAKFCRMCGTAFKAPPTHLQALPVVPDYGRALRPLFIGIAFLTIVLVSVFTYTGFFWWMIFPALSLLSKGVRRLNKMKPAHFQSALSTGRPNNGSPQQILLASYRDVQARPTGEMIAPPSVTENTTRLFD